ncbi:putative serine/threonine protein phosphatase [Pseudomonas phage phiPMW]|uniref:Putative serine/threonine protein phosphatase n=1 Tax=Pseudomonas phage phiPMW TaxID=1815582 RepID=A0A1S5R1C5_9CAUD|nr:NinI-like serine-threonine phosphatase [Pseudomonas phage phiPMW]ANA49210.1 putative serine/threonine protein phosphatase [Pseudomonas phage phiPMW]
MRKLIGSMNHIAHYDLRGYEGRLFYVSDTHGHFDLLQTELRERAFSPSNGDLLFSGGDWVDRGPQSQYVLDWLYEPWVHSVQANHERMHIDAFANGYDYRTCTNAATLAQHGGLWAWDVFEQNPVLMQSIIDAFMSLPLGIELETDFGRVCIVHAEVPYHDWEMFKNVTPSEFEHIHGEAQWGRRKYRGHDTREVHGAHRVLVGHTPTASTRLEQLGNVVYTDAGTARSGEMNLIEINEQFMRSKYVNH